MKNKTVEDLKALVSEKRRNLFDLEVLSASYASTEDDWSRMVNYSKDEVDPTVEKLKIAESAAQDERAKVIAAAKRHMLDGDFSRFMAELSSD